MQSNIEMESIYMLNKNHVLEFLEKQLCRTGQKRENVPPLMWHGFLAGVISGTTTIQWVYDLHCVCVLQGNQSTVIVVVSVLQRKERSNFRKTDVILSSVCVAPVHSHIDKIQSSPLYTQCLTKQFIHACLIQECYLKL